MAPRQKMPWTPVPRDLEPKVRSTVRAYLAKNNEPRIVPVWAISKEIKGKVPTASGWDGKRTRTTVAWAMKNEGYQLRSNTAYEKVVA